MTTTILHANVQRSRFAQHLLNTLTEMLPLALRRPLGAVRQPARVPGAAESAALEAQKVRSLAYSYTKTDPGFAADLYAAAARHEGMFGD